MAKPEALAAVLEFKRRWQPETMVHLGDFTDTTAFRSGARGTKDEAEPIPPDVDGGIAFLEKLEPTLVLCGNHEARVWTLATHHNAIVAYAAQQVVEAITDACKRLHSQLVPYSGVWEYRELGGFKYMHGSFYNENAPRDHAEAFGNCVHGHTHRAGLQKGRRIDNPTGFCVGTLTDIPNMDYANARRATLGWSHGFVWGEYCDDKSALWLHEQPRNATQWRLPI